MRSALFPKYNHLLFPYKDSTLQKFVHLQFTVKKGVVLKNSKNYPWIRACFLTTTSNAPVSTPTETTFTADSMFTEGTTPVHATATASTSQGISISNLLNKLLMALKNQQNSQNECFPGSPNEERSICKI